MLQEIKELLSCRICLEVEPPENEIAKRRINFYRRNGYFLNEYSYIQPSLSLGRKQVPLMIMTTESLVSEKPYEEIKSCLYHYVYHVS